MDLGIMIFIICAAIFITLLYLALCKISGEYDENVEKYNEWYFHRKG